ncbi:MAG: lytic transglycosylase domain-containing protein, partial [Firmicutes bacterium]|nr:lytic transglycosylase domain-containing protein [Bacillota bacterium]
QVTTVTSEHTVLIHAVTWDGTLTDRYQIVRTGKAGCAQSGLRTVTEHIRLVYSSRTYSWSRVWHLLDSIRTVPIISDSKGTRDLLASLIATQDPSLEDPYVQAMVDAWLTTGVSVSSSASLPDFLGDIAVKPANTSVLHNVLRWQSAIEADAARFDVPAVLVAAVMAQESGGREHTADGQVLTSGVGSGGLGALGLMQVEPSTASAMSIGGVSIGSQAVADLSNGSENLAIGVAYLAHLYHQFHDAVAEAASAYNAGPGAEEQALLQGDLVAQNPQTLAYVARLEGTWIPLFAPYFVTSMRVK